MILAHTDSSYVCVTHFNNEENPSKTSKLQTLFLVKTHAQ